MVSFYCCSDKEYSQLICGLHNRVLKTQDAVDSFIEAHRVLETGEVSDVEGSWTDTGRDKIPLQVASSAIKAEPEMTC
jgi:hypothetical protein